MICPKLSNEKIVLVLDKFWTGFGQMSKTFKLSNCPTLATRLCNATFINFSQYENENHEEKELEIIVDIDDESDN